MSIFNFTANKIEVSKEIAEIPIFKEIFEREDHQRILLYIYHVADWKSPYSNCPDEDRQEILKEEFLDGKEPDKTIAAAVNQYKDLNQTQAIKLLTSAKRAVHTLQKYFDEVDPSLEEDSGKAAKDLIMNISKVGSILNDLQEWEEIIIKEQDKGDTRKGVKLNKYNQ